MYISELKMHGFKSFANKEVMKLGQGITTVVGPNGCGKTNIVDAIRWVLGEQKYSVLRSGKMEDVIFNGADNTKPLGVCEVAMTVHNNAGKLPIEYNDIEIARRVYRSGESEYYLNKTQCRLKDIMNLFVDTGMGADAYSVIELKMIEQILSDTADDRRKMFEEAAGIHKYRTQKKSTIRKFEATRNDLERVKDIIAEVEAKVHNLELQLKRFKRHKNLTLQLEKRDKELAYLQVHRLAGHLKPLNARIIEFKDIRENTTSSSIGYEKELTELRNTYKLQEKDLDNFQISMKQKSDEREDLKNKILISSEQRRSALNSIKRLEKEWKNNFQKIEGLKQLELDFNKELIDLEPSISDLLNDYKIKKEKFIKLEEQYKKEAETLDRTQNQRWELQKNIAKDKSLFDRTRDFVESKSKSIYAMKERMHDLSTNNKAELGNQKTLESRKKILIESESELIEKINILGKNLLRINEHREMLSEKRNSNLSSKQTVSDQIDFFNGIIEMREGFPDGTRHILENPELFPGILGTVADMFQVDEIYRDALESGLGDISHCLISIDKKNAMSTLELAQKNSAGDFSIIPMNEASKVSFKQKRLPESENKITRAIDVIKTSNKFKPLADYLLGNLLFVDDLNSFVDLDIFNGWDVVDIKGAFIGQNLVLRNYQVSDYGNLIGREKKISTLKTTAVLLSDEQIKIDEEIERNIEDKKYKEEEINKINIELKDIREEISKVEMSILKSLMKSSQYDDEIVDLNNKYKDCKHELKEGKNHLKILKPQINKHNKDLRTIKKLLDGASDGMVSARKERDQFQSSLQNIKINLIELESSRDQLVFKKKSGVTSSKELESRQSVIKRKISDLETLHKELEEVVFESEKGLRLLIAEIQKEKSIIDLKQSVYRETYENIEHIQVKISSEQAHREKILEKLKKAELEAVELEQKVERIRERINERYETNLPEKLVIDLNENELNIEIEKINRSLINIGPINMVVQDEHKEQVERLDLLINQREDLIESEQNLKETIRKIDKVARKRFQKTFDMIKSNFESLFKLFFEGGNAMLSLSGDPDPLEAEISVRAQPPGKKNTSLRLLSSGEKALTAISLLFAIYQVKPSPYCILDEVDAPLDDVNIHKFTRVLGKFCDETQFIIVTHNKLTMEIADYMYGVTQEKKGISKLVSVKFD